MRRFAEHGWGLRPTKDRHSRLDSHATGRKSSEVESVTVAEDIFAGHGRVCPPGRAFPRCHQQGTVESREGATRQGAWAPVIRSQDLLTCVYKQPLHARSEKFPCAKYLRVPPELAEATSMDDAACVSRGVILPQPATTRVGVLALKIFDELRFVPDETRDSRGINVTETLGTMEGIAPSHRDMLATALQGQGATLRIVPRQSGNDMASLAGLT